MRVSLLILFCLSALHLFSQTEQHDNGSLVRYTTDPFVLQVNYNSWMEVPAPMELQENCMGVDLTYFLQAFKERSRFNIAIGGGVSVQNYKGNCTVEVDSVQNSYFYKIPDDLPYKRNKLTTVYADIPLEFRFATRPNVRNRNLRIALGIKASGNIQAFRKYQGKDFRFNNDEIDVKFKEYKLKNILPYRYGITFRLSYGKFGINGFYSLTELFHEGKGPELLPYSVGISIIPFR